MKYLRHTIIIVAMFFLMLSPMIGDGSDLTLDGYKTKQSDVVQTAHNSSYYMTVSGASAVFKNNSVNYFMASVDVVDFGVNITSWYDLGFYYRLQNLAENFTLVNYAFNLGVVSGGQMFFDYVFEVDVNSTFPSSFMLDLGVTFTENGIESDYDETNFWLNIITLTVDDDALIATITPRFGVNQTSTMTETSVVTEVTTDQLPYVPVPPSIIFENIGVDYTVAWVVFGDNPFQYRINGTKVNGTADGTVDGAITFDTPTILKQGAWQDGDTLFWDSVNQAETEGVYKFTLELSNTNGSIFYYETFAVITDKASALAALPIPFASILFAFVTSVILLKKNQFRA